MVCRKTEIIAREGWAYIAVFALLFCLTLFLGFSFLSVVFAILTLLFAYMFRNPERVPDEYDDMSILSPIDGRVKFIGKVFEDKYYNKEMLKISIVNSLMDLSIQRNPFDMSIEKSLYIHGLNIDVDSKKADLLNERVEVRATFENRDILIKTVLGKCARNIYKVCPNFKKVRQGDRYLIVLNGKVELFLPLECRLNISENEKVKGGESIIGYFMHDK
ncbi:MAG: hypothetical protein GXO12_03815 [Epsilonproteobacteria bacterium]|nr:hypothetical protein [Campylobacterota bacterium]